MKSSIKNWTLVLAAAAGLAWSGAAAHADTVEQSYNVGTNVANSTWTNADVGWTIVASSNYQLTGIDTLFNDFQSDGGDLRTVTLQVFSNAPPSSGGVLLRQASFVPTSGTLGGVNGLVGTGNFTPLVLTSGQSYFIGYRNVAGEGLNIASPGSPVSNLRFSTSDDGLYSSSTSLGASRNGILQLRGTEIAAVPLPAAALPGFALLAGLGLVRKIRSRHKLEM